MNIELKIDREAVYRVGAALEQGNGDLSECLAPDLKKVAELLAHVALLEDIAPGVLADILRELIPFYIKKINSESIVSYLEEKAKKGGFEAELAAVFESKKHRNYSARFGQLT